jgi:NADPH2:quinone reductase
VLRDPERARRIGREVGDLIDRGYVRPIVGQRFPLERASEALGVIDRREAMGKVVLDVGHR